MKPKDLIGTYWKDPSDDDIIKIGLHVGDFWFKITSGLYPKGDVWHFNVEHNNFYPYTKKLSKYKRRIYGIH